MSLDPEKIARAARMLDSQPVPTEGRLIWPPDWAPDYSQYVWECAACGQICEGTFITGTPPEFYCKCGERYPRP